MSMDYWGCMSEERGMYLSEEFEFQYDNNHGYNNKSKFEGCENKPLVNVERYPLVSNTQGFAKSSFMDMGLSDEFRKSYSIFSEPSGEVFSDEIDNVASSFGEKEHCGSDVISTSFTRLNNKELSVVDLNLVRDGDLTETNVVSSPRVKRSRSTSSVLQFPRCQVLGCNKDLGSYKGYYKRHKVCSEHTRTTKVVVNGTEQRFCQQCSRFHQLAEFDDGRRSCRKRLAVHNKRRRKPQFPCSPSTGMINFSSSCPFSERLPTSTTSPKTLEDWKWPDNIKVEDPIESSSTFFHINSITENAQDVPVDVKANFTGTSTSTMRKSSVLRQTSRALSLLSAQSRNMSNQLLGPAFTSPLLDENDNEGSHLKHALNSSRDVEDMLQNGFHKTEMHLMDADSLDHTLVTHSDGNTVDQHLSDDGILRESGTRNTPIGGGMVLDLLQLSSRLHRIEQNKLSTESEAG